MKYRQLGDSDLTVSAIAFGAWAVGGFMWAGTDDEKAVAAIQKAADLGVSTIDTAPIYGMGHSETIVGRAIRDRRDRVQLLTKFGLDWETSAHPADEGGSYRTTMLDPHGDSVRLFRNGTKRRVIYECEQSLKRLGTDYIDLYQQHYPHLETPIEETFEAVAQLLQDGKIRYAGVSNFTVEQIEAARRVVPIVSVQSPYSLVNRKIEQDIIPCCSVDGLSVIAYSPMQRGLLTGKIPIEREFPETDERSHDAFFTPENRRRVLALLEQIRPIADAHGATLAQTVLAWTIQQPGITVALAGARNPRQAEENAAAADLDLSQAEVDRIGQLAGGIALDV